MSKAKVFPHTGHQMAERWVREIEHGRLNFQEVSERHLPRRDPLRTVVGRDEEGFAEVYQHVLEDFADVGEPEKRFGWIYAYGMNLRSRLEFVDGESTMRLPRYRKQPTTNATPESGRNDEGVALVAQDVSRAYVVLDDKDPDPQPVPAPIGPDPTRDREIGVGHIPQGQEWWRKWAHDLYVGRRLTLQDAELVVRSKQETNHPVSLTSRDERTGGNTVSGGFGLLGPTVGMGLFGEAEPFVRTSDRRYRSGPILLAITDDGVFRFGKVDCQGEGPGCGWDKAATVATKHNDGTDPVDWDSVLGVGELGVETTPSTALKVKLPTGVETIGGGSTDTLVPGGDTNSDATVVLIDTTFAPEETEYLVTLPSASAWGGGLRHYKNIGVGGKSAVLTPYDGQTIDSEPNRNLAVGQSVAIASDGSNLHTL